MVLIALALPLLGGCATLFRGVAPNGLARPEDGLRRHVIAGRFDDALSEIGPSEEADPGDDLLAALYEGLLAHYAGDPVASSRAFEVAIFLAEDHYTRSLSREALSFVSNDRLLPFQPDRAERLLIHYYNALNYYRMGDLDGAAVEARRLSAILQRYDDSQDPGDVQLRAAMRYFAGTIFEAVGDFGDADVAYRNAQALLGKEALPLGTLPARDTLGDVVVFIERGFVAHRVEQSINLALLPHEVDALSSGGESRAGAAALISTRVLAELLTSGFDPYESPRRRTLTISASPEARRWAEAEARRICDEVEAAEAARRTRRSRNDSTTVAERQAARRRCDEAKRRTNPFFLRLAWPTYYREWRPGPTPSVRAGEEEAFASWPLISADLSRAVIGEFERQRGTVLVRTLLRGAAKYAVSRGLERGAESVDESLGQVAGLIGNITGALLEQADTRSWHLLPDQLHIVRLRLPPGTHPVRVRLGTGEGSEVVDLGEVVVRPGAVALLSTRVFR